MLANGYLVVIDSGVKRGARLDLMLLADGSVVVSRWVQRFPVKTYCGKHIKWSAIRMTVNEGSTIGKELN